MALKSGTNHILRAGKAYQTGQVPDEALDALLKSLERKIGAQQELPDISVVTVSAVTSTAQAVTGGPSRLYAVRVVSPATGSTLDVIVGFLDGTVPIQCGVKCKSSKAAEAYFYAGDEVVGVPIATALNVKAFAAADGTSAVAAGDQPTVIVYVGN